MEISQVLKRPIITEKSLELATQGKFSFEVDSRARKPEIAKAVEGAFGVHVVSVRTVNVRGKKRRFGPRRKEIELSGFKKAIVGLVPGETIEVFAVPGGKQEAKRSQK